MIYSSIQQDIGNLREHQKDAKARIFDAWDNADAVMLQMPTGTGKTYLFTSVVKDLLNHYKEHRQQLNILVVAHRTELIDQISASLSRYGIPHGFIQGNREQHLWQRVQVGSIFSLLTSRNEVNVKRKNFDYIIVDEAHHSLADTYKHLFETFPKAKKLGVTATPWRFNHEPFTSLYQQLITTPQVSWFIKKGLLADFEYVSIRPDSNIQRMIDNAKVAPMGEFMSEELEEAFNCQRIRAKVYEAYKKFANGRKGIIYAISKSHAANLAALYNVKGVSAVAIDCDTPKDERKNLIDDFKNGKIQVLVNVEIFTEGFDCPDVSFIQLARPTRSLALYLQQVGRGLRVLPNKEKTIIIDNVGLYNYFGLPDIDRDWQKHFNGCEDFKEVTKGGHRILPEEEPVVQEYDEDDETMMVIRGANEGCIVSISDEKNEKNDKPLPITEFALCDYYLVIGNRDKFKLYPFIKRRGIATAQVGNCVFEYDKNVKELVFTEHVQENVKLINDYAKAKNVLVFLGVLLGIGYKQLVDISNLQNLHGETQKKTLSFFDLLKIISNIPRALK